MQGIHLFVCAREFVDLSLQNSSQQLLRLDRRRRIWQRGHAHRGPVMLHMHVSMKKSICKNININVYAYVYIYVYICICIYTYIHIYINKYTYIYMYIYIYVYIYINVFIYIYIHIYIFIDIFVYTHKIHKYQQIFAKRSAVMLIEILRCGG